MASWKKSRKGRNLTAEKKARAEAKVNAAKCGADPEKLEAVRRCCMIQSKDRSGETKMVHMFYLKGTGMEAILKVNDAAAIAAGLLEALEHGMNLEVDAQMILCEADKDLCRALAVVFTEKAEELELTCDERKERLASLLQSLAGRMSYKARAEVKQIRPKSKPAPKPESLEAVLDRELAIGTDEAVKTAAKAIAEARLVDDDVLCELEKIRDNCPDLAEALAINLRRRARRAKNGKAKFLNRLAQRVYPIGATDVRSRKSEKRQVA
jgi:hypothetical protein